MKIHNMPQGSPEWHALRLIRNGASEAAAMLGLSKKTTRSELLRMKHSGTPKEFSDWVQKNILDYGHEVEAMARPLIEEMIGEDLYPVTCSNEDVGGNLSASCDGLTMNGDIAFEHKQWNTDLATSVANGILPEEHMPQCQQIMLVTGAMRVIFTVSDGTPEKCVHMEVHPDPAWFARIEAGWAQFDRDRRDYVAPDVKQEAVGEAVQTLPAVSVQVSGSIDIRDNFKVFETALRDFLENKLIREPRTDQDFADLDLQIKALKKAEEMLDAAESMMLAQIQSVDEAKRQKDMLAKLVRDNRLMAEKMLAKEKEYRRESIILATRNAFSAHITELQREIKGAQLEVVAPDFYGATKGLKTLTSMQDKLDGALASAKIAANEQAADIRKKTDWVNGNADNHRHLLHDLQQLIAKPYDDFRLAITVRIDAFAKAEAAKLEAERERIRKEEEAKAEAKARAEAEAKAREEEARIRAEQQAVEQPTPRPAPTPTPIHSPVVTDQPPTLSLGKINERLAPISVSADGLASLGITHAATNKAAKLYHDDDFYRICSALTRHISECRMAH